MDAMERELLILIFQTDSLYRNGQSKWAVRAGQAVSAHTQFKMNHKKKWLHTSVCDYFSITSRQKSIWSSHSTSERESVSHSLVSDSLQCHGLYSAWLLCPWNSPGKNTRVGSHSLLRGIFLTQGSNLGIPTLQADSLLSEPPGKLTLLPRLYQQNWKHTLEEVFVHSFS